MEVTGELDLMGQNLISLDLAAILTALNLDTITGPSELKDRIENCEVCNFHCNKLSSLQGLPYLNNVTELNLSSNNFSISSLPELAFLPGLQKLDLSSNMITSIAELPFMPGLQNFIISHNFLKSLDGLDENVPNVEVLDVRGNELKKNRGMQCLHRLKSLEDLSICSKSNTVTFNPANVMEMFSMCESLQNVDSKNLEEWQTESEQNVPTPHFDKISQQYKQQYQRPHNNPWDFEESWTYNRPGSLIQERSSPFIRHEVDEDEEEEEEATKWTSQYQRTEDINESPMVQHNESEKVTSSPEGGLNEELESPSEIAKERHYNYLAHLSSLLFNFLQREYQKGLYYQAFNKLKNNQNQHNKLRVAEEIKTLSEEMKTLVAQHAAQLATVAKQWEKRLLMEKQRSDTANRKYVQSEMALSDNRKKAQIAEEEMVVASEKAYSIQGLFDSLSVELKENKSQLETLQSTENVLRDDLWKMEGELASSRQEVATLSEEKEEAETELQISRQSLSSKDAIINELRTISKETKEILAREKEDKMKELQILQDNIKSLEINLSAVQSTTQAKEQELSIELQNNINQVEAFRTKEDLQDQVRTKLESRLVKLQVAFESMSDARDELAANNEELRQHSHHDRQTIRELGQCVEKLQAILNHNRHKETTVQHMEEQMVALERENHRLQHICEQQEERVRDLIKENSELSKEKDELEILHNLTELNSEKQIIEDTMTQLEQENQALQDKANELQAVLRVKEAMLNDQAKEISDLKQRIEAGDLELQTLEEAADEAEGRLESMESAMAEVEELSRGWERCAKSLYDQVLQLQQVLEVLKDHDLGLSPLITPLLSLSREHGRIPWRDNEGDVGVSISVSLGGESEWDIDILSVMENLVDIDVEGFREALQIQRNAEATGSYNSNNEYVGCHRNELCRSQIQSLMEEVHTLEIELAKQTAAFKEEKAEFERKMKSKSEECAKISQALSKLEEDSVLFANTMVQDKARYGGAEKQFQEDKRKLAMLCRKFESELAAKEEEMKNMKKAKLSLTTAFKEYQAMVASTDTS